MRAEPPAVASVPCLLHQIFYANKILPELNCGDCESLLRSNIFGPDVVMIAEMKLTQGEAKPWDRDENVLAVLSVREKSRQALLARDFTARKETYSSTYVAHTPDYTIVDERALMEALASERVSYDAAEYSIEYARTHSPELVVLMGVETVIPSAGRPNAGLKVPRRFTDIYRKEHGEWRHDLRHAHIAVAELARGVVPPS